MDCLPPVILVISIDLCVVTSVLLHGVVSKAVSTFSGVTRNHHGGKSVLLLRYEAYHEMALRQLLGICGDARKQWDVHSIAVGHRTGVVGVREVSANIVALSLLLFCLLWVGFACWNYFMGSLIGMHLCGRRVLSSQSRRCIGLNRSR